MTELPQPEAATTPDTARVRPRKRRRVQIECSREWILEAYSRLIDQMPDDKITVTAICAAAGVGRQTFYRHFRNKKDVLRYKMDGGYRRYCQILQAYPREKVTIEVMLLEAFEYWQRYNVALNPLVHCEDLRFWFIEKVTRIWRNIAREFFPVMEANQYDIEFQIAGITGVFLHWLERDMHETPREITAIIVSLLDDHNTRQGRSGI